MRYVVIENSIVINAIEAADDFAPDDLIVVASDTAQKGDTWDGSAFIPAPPPPEVFPDLTMRQFRLALITAGLDDDVEAALAAMPGTAGKLARAEYAYASTVVRDNALIAGLAGALGLDDDEINTLWRSAAAL